MRLAAPAAILLGFAAATLSQTARAQVANPNLPAASATISGPAAPATCGMVSGSTAGSPIAQDCTVDGSAHVDAHAAVAPGTAVSTSVQLHGTNPAQRTDVDAWGQYYQYVTVSALGGSHPITDIFKIMIQSTVDFSQSSDDPANTAQTAFGTLEVGSVVDDQGDTNFGGADGTDILTDASGAVHHATLTLSIAGGDLGPSSTFYYLLYSESHLVDAGVGSNITASSSIFAPTITIFGGTDDDHLVDLTSQYALAFNPAAPVTSTPEPAALALMATGLAGVVGVARRRHSVPAP